MTRTTYDRYHPVACQAITGKGDPCPKAGRPFDALVEDGIGMPLPIRLCRTHEKTLAKAEAGFPILGDDGLRHTVHPRRRNL